MDQNNGGILGKINTPTTTVASGVWSLDSQFEAQSSSIWPLAFPNTTIANSLRFESTSNDNLTLTPSSTGNRSKFTISFWIKRAKLGGSDPQRIFSVDTGSTTQEAFVMFETDDSFRLFSKYDGSNIDINYDTNRVFRDTSAWYHMVWRVDTTESTESNRVRLYVNGVEETSFASQTEPSQNDITRFNEASRILRIGERSNGNDDISCYLAEVVMLDGQALDPTSFGAFNPVTNIWEPIAYAGTYGTNGFRLDFADSSALGNDVSGNDNDFTVNNLTSIDQATDTCSNNFAVMNPLDNYYASSTFSEGNTKIVTDASAKAANTSTFGISSGKWYCEIKAVQIYNGYAQFGIKGTVPTSTTDGVGDGTDGYAYTASGGNKVNNGSASSYGTVWNNNDIIGIAVDLDNNKLYFSRNGTFQDSGDPTSGSTGTGAAFSLGTPSSGAYYIATSDGDTGGGSANTYEFNFGNSPFSISSGNADANGHGNFEYAVPLIDLHFHFLCNLQC